MEAKRIWLIAMVLLGILIFKKYISQEDRIKDLRSEITGLREEQNRLASLAARSQFVVRTQLTATTEPSMTELPMATMAPVPSTQINHNADDSTAHVKRWEEEAKASLASVEGAFAAEPIDDSWAMPTRLALRDNLISVSQTSFSSLRNIDCRSSICRVEIVYRDVDASRLFTEKAFIDPNQRAWNGPVVITPAQPNSDGSLAVIMYLGREGTSLLKRER